MKKYAVLLLSLLFTCVSRAQPQPLVQDKENLFTADEISRIDSMLQGYRQRTGKLVLVVSDTTDVSTAGYADQLARQYVPDSTAGTFVFMVLFSRKNQLLFTAVNNPLKPHINQELLINIIKTGIPSLQEKRREEAATLICQKAMLFLDGIAQ